MKRSEAADKKKAVVRRLNALWTGKSTPGTARPAGRGRAAGPSGSQARLIQKHQPLRRPRPAAAAVPAPTGGLHAGPVPPGGAQRFFEVISKKLGRGLVKF